MRREGLIALGGRLASPYRIRPPELPVGGPAGIFSGGKDGQSVDFHDFREYQPGDDLRRVDWRAYARSGQMHLKLFREEVSPVVELFLDNSASMGAYPGKEQAAIFLTAFLRGVTLASEGRPVLCLDGGRFPGGDFEPTLAAAQFAGGGGMVAPAGRVGSSRPLRFLVSDCLFDGELAALFKNHASGSLHFSPFMILSQSEIDPPWRGYCRLRDVELPESALDVALTDKSVAAYRSRLQKHEEALAGEARRNGGRLLRLDVPDGDLEAADCENIVRHLVGERVVSPR